MAASYAVLFRMLHWLFALFRPADPPRLGTLPAPDPPLPPLPGVIEALYCSANSRHHLATHHPTHNSLIDRPLHAAAAAPGATHGEPLEMAWSAGNMRTPLVKEMAPGRRRSSLEDHLNVEMWRRRPARGVRAPTSTPDRSFWGPCPACPNAATS
ncbi:hypothetical protein C8R47DRAFT_1228821 [Mycena vitilis]|nr:hypothetical protein C8R47DRAFT_1228821 [Mycena vitilis]